jgi:hypothetical protein
MIGVLQASCLDQRGGCRPHVGLWIYLVLIWLSSRTITVRQLYTRELIVDDHLDKATILDIERHHQDVKYLVPTGVKRILTGFGVPPVRVQELGWWAETTIITESETKCIPKQNEIDVIFPAPTFELSNEDPPLSPTSTFFSQTTLTNDTSITATCCPAQHNSGRGLFSQHKTLWASWYLTCRLPVGGVYRVYFGG